jgi:hypothetical protein
LRLLNGEASWKITGWWFQTWLLWLLFHINGIYNHYNPNPIDELIFFRGVALKPPTR